MSVEILRLKAVVEADIRDFERGLAKAEADARKSAREIKSELNGIKVGGDVAGFKALQREAKKAEQEAKRAARAAARASREFGQSLGELIEEPIEGLLQLGGRFGAVGLAAVGATLAAGAATYGFAKLTAEVVEQARELEQLSRVTGLSTGSLQVMQLAASTVGAELPQIAGAFADFQSKTLEASAGNERLRETFRRLGIDATQALRQPDEAFNSLVKRISEIPSATERAAAAQAVFGDAGRELLPVFDQLGQDQERLQKLLRESGALFDSELKNSAREVTAAFAELKISGQGALNTIARESLLETAAALREVAGLIRDLKPAWEVAGDAAGGFAAKVSEALNTARGMVAFFQGDLEKARELARDDALRRTQGVTDLAEARRILLGAAPSFGGAEGVERLLKFSEPHLFKPGQPGPGFRPPADSKGGGAGGDGARAELELQRAQSEARLEITRDAKQRELRQLESSLADELRSYGRNYDDSLTALDIYYRERIRLQRDAIRAEIDQQKELLASLAQEEAKARTRPEKLRLQAQQTRTRARLDVLTSGLGDVDLRENAARTEAAGKILADSRSLKKELANEVKQIQAELVNLSGTELEKFSQQIAGMTSRLQELAIILNDQNALQALREFREAATQNFKDSQLPRQYETDVEQLNLGRERIERLSDRGHLTEGQARRQMLDLERQMRDTLRENLNLQIQIAKSRGDELTAVKLERDLEQVEQLGDKQRDGEQRLKDFKTRVAQLFDDSIQALVTGQAKFSDVWRGFVSTLVSDIFQELQKSLIKSLTDDKYSSLGQMVGDLVGKALGKLFKFGSNSGTQTAGDKAGDVAQAVQTATQQQTQQLSAVLNNSLGKETQMLAVLRELAACSCSTSGPGQGQSGAASGLTSALTGKLTGGGGESGGGYKGAPSGGYFTGRHGVPLRINTPSAAPNVSPKQPPLDLSLPGLKDLGDTFKNKADDLGQKVTRQTDQIGGKLDRQSGQLSQVTTSVNELANTILAGSGGDSFWGAVLKGAISGAASGLTSALTGKLTGGGGESGGGYKGAPSGGYFTGSHGVPLRLNTPKRAAGGPVTAGTLYEVNETEQEFFRPNANGQVIPLSRMKAAQKQGGGGGGLTVVNNFYVSAADGKLSRESQQQTASSAALSIQRAYRRNR